MKDGWDDVRHADDVRSPLWEEAVAASAARGALAPAESTAPDEPLAEEDVDGNLRRYARWQWRDFWTRRGGWMALGAVLGVWLLVYIATTSATTNPYQGMSAAQAAMRQAMVARSMATACFTLGGALAALLGVGGLVARERERGLQRFLFAKPLRPLRYYLQAFGVNTVGSLAVLGGAILAAAVVLPALWPVVGTLAAMGAGAYVLTAGVLFLASTLVRFDVALAAAWLVAGFPVAIMAENHFLVPRALSWLFPQGWIFSAMHVVERATPRVGDVDGASYPLAVAVMVMLAALYGLLAFAGGVVVLRRRPVST